MTTSALQKQELLGIKDERLTATAITVSMGRSVDQHPFLHVEGSFGR
jgi:hypothetical protein